jgi:hypothetical protein
MTVRLVAATVVLLGSSCSASVDASTPDVTATEELQAERSLSSLGDRITIDAVDNTGTWGTIALVRGSDTGGYPLDAIDPATFILEVEVHYAADRQPDTDFGRGDWVLVGEDGLPVGGLFSPALPADPADFDPNRQELGVFPGAMDVAGSSVDGMLYLQIPRAAADEQLFLVYRPVAFKEGLVTILLRPPDPAPTPEPTATPVPTPEPVSYVERPGLPFTVIADARADALFTTTLECHNPELGFTVSYPSSWAADESCHAFGPDGAEISLNFLDGAIGFFNAPDYDLSQSVAIDGWTGTRVQSIGVTHESGAYQALPPSYAYTFQPAGSDGLGPTLVAGTSSEGLPDYVRNRAVLDRMMASLRFDE